MKYYVVSDVHGFYSILRNELEKAGFFSDPQPHKLLVLGDLFDRGKEAVELQDFIINLMNEDKVILIRGNHEDLFVKMVTEDGGRAYSHHRSNGTHDTALQLTGFDPKTARVEHVKFTYIAKKTPYYQKIIPAMRNYYETENYVFVHGWIPSERFLDKEYYVRWSYLEDWRDANEYKWEVARWINGMEAVEFCKEKKTVVCGHWHTSFGHANLENNGSEFGPDADFSPYIADGIVALDACTAHSGKMNVYIVEDKEFV